MPTFPATPPGPGREVSEPLLVDPQSQSPAPIPALAAFCFATRTWAPTSPQSLAYRASQGESSLDVAAARKLDERLHPISSQTSSLPYRFTSALAVPRLQDMAGSGGTLLLWFQSHTRSPWTACVGHKLLSKQLGSPLLFITNASASPST